MGKKDSKNNKNEFRKGIIAFVNVVMGADITSSFSTVTKFDIVAFFILLIRVKL
jgi:hypothetical protein